MASHTGRPVFATNASGVKTWTATPALAGVLGRSGKNSPLDCFLVPLTPFGGVHTSTGAPPTARFPGQWFQSESGLHQNWMRDYDPTTGRYLQADPLGLIAGMNVYGYAHQNPMSFVDPDGRNPVIACLLNRACAAGVLAAATFIYNVLCADEFMDYV